MANERPNRHKHGSMGGGGGLRQEKHHEVRSTRHLSEMGGGGGGDASNNKLLSALPPAIEGAVTADFIGINNTVVEVFYTNNIF